MTNKKKSQVYTAVPNDKTKTHKFYVIVIWLLLSNTIDNNKRLKGGGGDRLTLQCQMFKLEHMNFIGACVAKIIVQSQDTHKECEKC